MGRKLICLFACLFVIVYLTDASAVSFITKCKKDDTKCAKETTSAAIPIYAQGIPELGVQPLDPIFFKKIDASSNLLKLILTDVTVTGIKSCFAKKMQRDVENSKLLFKVQCDVNLDGQYEMNGRLLIIPIEGKGKVHAGLKKIVINLDVDVVENDIDGKKHWEIKSHRHNFELKDKADVFFENLFNGNEILGQAAREVIANSGNEIVLEVGPPVIKASVNKVVSSVKHFFKNVPIEDMSLD